MKKIMIMGLVLILLLGIAGCGNSDQTNSNDSSSDGQNSAANGVTNGGNTQQWPTDIGNIPEFTYGDIDRVEKASEMYDGVKFLEYHIYYTNIKDGAGDKYSSDLENAGFRESQPPMENESSINGVTTIEYGHDIFTFETEDTIYNINVDHWINSDNNGAVNIDIPVNPEGGGSMDNNNTEGSDEVVDSDTGDNDSSGFNWNTLSDSEIPKDYPHDIVPIVGVDGGDILGASRQEMGGMGVSYVIVFGVNDSVANVSDKIGKELKQNASNAGGTFNSLSNQVFMGKIDNYEYTVAIGDGKADGYTTTVDYTVIHLAE